MNDFPNPTPEEVEADLEALWTRHDSEVAKQTIIKWVAEIFSYPEIVSGMLRADPRFDAAELARIAVDEYRRIHHPQEELPTLPDNFFTDEYFGGDDAA